MNRTEGERLVERYLSGTMTGAEEQDFFIQVAVDSNLRQTLRAYRIVEGAIQKHRDSVPAQHTSTRSRVVGMLNVPAEMSGLRGGETVAGGAMRRGGAGAFVLGWRQIVLASITIALIGYLALNFLTGNSMPATGARAVGDSIHRSAAHEAQRKNLPIVAAPTEQTKESINPDHNVATEAGNVNLPMRHQATADAVQRSDRSPQEPRGGQASGSAREARQPDRGSLPPQTAEDDGVQQSAQAPPQETRHHSTPRISARDTIKIRVKIGLPQEQ